MCTQILNGFYRCVIESIIYLTILILPFTAPAIKACFGHTAPSARIMKKSINRSSVLALRMKDPCQILLTTLKYVS